MSARAWTLLALLAAVVATAAAAAPKTIVEAVAEDPKLSELSKFLKKVLEGRRCRRPGCTY